MFRLEDNYHSLYKFDTLQECFDQIKELVNVKYYRIIPKDYFHRIHIDYGSHTHFFEITSDHNFEEECREMFGAKEDKGEIDRNEYKKAMIYNDLSHYYNQLYSKRHDEFFKQLIRDKIKNSEKILKELL